VTRGDNCELPWHNTTKKYRQGTTCGSTVVGRHFANTRDVDADCLHVSSRSGLNHPHRGDQCPGMLTSPRIIVVEDEGGANAICWCSTSVARPCAWTGVADGPGFSGARSSAMRLRSCLLDVGLPGEGRVRPDPLFAGSLPVGPGVIMVSVASDTIDRVRRPGGWRGTTISPKPFEPRELLARVKSVLRRASSVATGELSGPRVTMGRAGAGPGNGGCCWTPTAWRNGSPPGEFNLLRLFRGEPETVRLARANWLLEVTSPPRGPRRSTAPIDLRITRLRREDRARSGPPGGDPHGARRRLHVRAEKGA